MATPALLARKVGMTSTIDKNGVVRAITLMSSEEQTVTSLKTTEKDGYRAYQVGFEQVKKIKKSISGQVSKLNIMPRILREFRYNEEQSNKNVGDKINVGVFSIGDIVNVSALSKGKGWAGTIKRHNFHRGRKTHGGRSYRRPGSIGSMYPQHIFKGKKMAGRMGHNQVTIKNLEVALVDIEKNLIGIFGSVPGPRKGLITIKGVKNEN